MKQYADVFHREMINGEVLVDMDEEMMEKDLGIGTKFHRMRLMKVSRAHCMCLARGERYFVVTSQL